MECSSVRSLLSRSRWFHTVKVVDADVEHLLVTRCQKPDQKEFLKVCFPRQREYLACG